MIDRPIFILGSGRSGTTLLLKLFTMHPDLAWFSNYLDWYPDRYWVSAAGRIWDIPFIGQKIAGRILELLPSDESINIYTRCQMHDLHWKKQQALTEIDLTSEAANKMKKIISKTLTYRGKKRFVNKNTNNCARVRYLNRIFPDAIFVHILRDGRAVSNSLHKVDWWPNLVLWWAGFTPNEWKSAGKNPIELCALHWMHMVSTVFEAKPYLKSEQYVEIKYEDLARNPMYVMQDLVNFCGLRWMPTYETSIKNVKVQNYNYKWRTELQNYDQDILNDILGDFLRQLDYPIDDE